MEPLANQGQRLGHAPRGDAVDKGVDVHLNAQELNRGDWIALRVQLALLHAEADAHPDLEVGPSGLSISTFRYVPEELQGRVGEEEVETYLNALNKEIQARLEQAGELFLSNAVVEGRYLLRGCIVNFRTDEDDVRAIPGIVERVGGEVHRDLRDSSE